MMGLEEELADWLIKWSVGRISDNVGETDEQEHYEDNEIQKKIQQFDRIIKKND